jgi:phage N-6-adenine-methyltransferase
MTGTNSSPTDRNQWATPPHLIDAARDAMGGIDLDPCTHAAAQERIQATRYYTKADNGLLRAWEGRVWCNPPYGRKIIDRFVAKFCEEYESGCMTQGVLLVSSNAHNNEYMLPFFDLRPEVCLLYHPRTAFLNDDGEAANKANGGHTIYYVGHLPLAFRVAFRRWGYIPGDWK